MLTATDQSLQSTLVLTTSQQLVCLALPSLMEQWLGLLRQLLVLVVA
jgi:hypothetical protein